MSGGQCRRHWGALAVLLWAAAAVRAQWSVETAVTNATAGANARVAVACAAGYVHVLVRGEGAGQPLYYYRGSNAADGVTFAGRALGNPRQPNSGDKAFAMRAGADGRVRILISGPGGAPELDYVTLGTETAAGSGVFAWEEIVTNNRWANQVGFVLDQQDKVYAALKYQPTAQCAILDNVAGTWRETRFSAIDPDYPRALVAVDPYNAAWVVFNGRHSGTNYLEVWSNRGGGWAFEMHLTNAPAGAYAGCYFLQTAAGFEFDNEGHGHVALKPDWWSRNLEVWQFGPVPEPGAAWGLLAAFTIYHLRFTIGRRRRTA